MKLFMLKITSFTPKRVYKYKAFNKLYRDKLEIFHFVYMILIKKIIYNIKRLNIEKFVIKRIIECIYKY